MGKTGANQVKNDNIKEINYLRGFGVLAVIAIHTTGYFTEVHRLNSIVLAAIFTDVFSQFAVPLFILISGFVLAKNYSHHFSLGRFYRRRIRSIIPQYVIFSVLYTLSNNWSVMLKSPLTQNLRLILKNIWESNASYHLWFFAIIIQLYILYPLIIKIYAYFKSKNRSELLMTFLLILQSLWMVGLHTSYSSYIKINFISYIFYFGMGIYLSEHYFALKKSVNPRLTPFLLTISLILTVGASFFIILGLKQGYQYYSTPPYFAMGGELIYPVLRFSTFLFLYYLACRLVTQKSAISNIINKLGDYSFGIYLIHLFFNQYSIYFLKQHHIDYNNWIFYPSVFLFTVIFSYLAVRLISFLPFSYYIIGSRNKIRQQQQ